MSRKPQRKKKPSSQRRVGALGDQLPDNYQSAFAQAVSQHRQGQLPQAEQTYRAILQHYPRHADSLHLLGVIAQSVGKSDIAVKLIDQAIAINKAVSEYWFNRGIALQNLERHEEAAASYQSALRLKPDFAQAQENLGVALQDQGLVNPAMQAYERAIELNKRSIIALKNLGTLLFQLNRSEEALTQFNRALDCSPADPKLHMKRFGCLMRLGYFEQGWSDYEWRTNAGERKGFNPVRATGLPNWDGAPLEDRQVLIAAEQGIGDEIMFASCYGEIAEASKRCVIECDPRLVPLFSRSFAGVSVIATGADFPLELELRIGAASIPRFRRRQPEDFPTRRGYLVADSELRSHWRQRLATLDKPLSIGISWKGGVKERDIRARAVSLNQWRPLLKSSNANFISLQYGDHSAEINAFNQGCDNPLIAFDELDCFNDIDSLCALIAELDLVISVDNSTVHFAGALGTEVWALLPLGPDWRWPDGAERSDWYPSARLFRNGRIDRKGWDEVLVEVSRELATRSRNGGEPVSRQPATLAPAAAPSVPVVSGREPGNGYLLLNDTSNWYHWGCSCTSIAIYQHYRHQGIDVRGVPISRTRQLEGLPASGDGFDSEEVYQQFCRRYPNLIAEMTSAGAILINGEGTLHGLSPASQGLLYLAHIAKRRLGKSVAIINHSCYPDDFAAVTDSAASRLYQQVYRELDYLAVREPVSQRLLTQLGIDCQLSFDCLPLFVERYFQTGMMPAEKAAAGDQTVLVAGSVAWDLAAVAKIADFIQHVVAHGHRVRVLVGAAAHMASDDIGFVRQLQQRLPDQFELRYAASESDWLGEIAGAALLVSGRFHHSIAAACLNTPFLVSQSNTPKVSGLLESLELSSALFDIAEISAEDLLQRAQEALANPESFRVSVPIRQRLLERAGANFPSLL